MTTFKSSPAVGRQRISQSYRDRMTIAQIAETVVAPPFPFRLTAFDGSDTGPSDSPYGIHLADPRALSYILAAPGDLGMARAYISGDLQFAGVHPADPYPLLSAMADGMHLHRPSLVEIAGIAKSLGLKTLTPVPPPPQEAPPRWRRVARGLRHSKARDAESIGKHYDVSNKFYEHVLGPSMAYTCAVYDSANTTLDQAQEAKYELVFDKLGLRPGERLLDVGCGWGSMVRHAARRGIKALGVTLSLEQAAWAQQAILGERACKTSPKCGTCGLPGRRRGRIRCRVVDRIDRTYRSGQLPGLFRVVA